MFIRKAFFIVSNTKCGVLDRAIQAKKHVGKSAGVGSGRNGLKIIPETQHW